MAKIFTVDWFTGNIESWTHFLKNYKNEPDLKFLEIGVFQGRSTCWLMDNILTNSTAHLDCVDPFLGSDEHVGIKEIETLYETFLNNTTEYGSKISVYKTKSKDFLFANRNNVYDVIYIDGDHHSWGCLEDMVFSWDLLKPNGIMIMDDYGQLAVPGNTNPIYTYPTRGVDSFLESYQSRYIILHVAWQLIIQKIW